MTKLQDQLGIEKEKHIPIFNNSTSRNKPPMISTIFKGVVLLGVVAYFVFVKKARSNGNFAMKMLNIDTNIGTRVERPKTRMKDVAGLKEAKYELQEFIDFLKNATKYKKVGAKIPKGALLVGPPGTGKTLLARAIAGESDCSFLSASGSDFIEVVGGLGSIRVKKLFRKAELKKPSIIFIDELDAIASKRGRGVVSNTERESTLNQLLVEMDGFNSSSGVVVIGATNFPEVLDPAFTRAGRLDRKIQVNLPDISERKEIFDIHLKALKTKIDKSVIATKIAALTPQFSGADIAHVCNEAAIVAGRDKKLDIEMKDFVKALDRVIAGIEKSKPVISPDEQRHIAIHEAGHAVAGWFLKHTDPLLKVTITPRTGGVMGFAQYLPRDIALMRPEEVHDTIAMALGGRIAELIFFNHLSTGAANDLQKVTELAYQSVKVFGFSDKIGHLSLPTSDNNLRNPFSKKMGDKIDSAVQTMVKKIFEKTKELMILKKDKIKALADKLIEKESVNHQEIIQILGPKPNPSDEYKKYLDVIQMDVNK